MAIKQFYLQAIPFHNEGIAIKKNINIVEQFRKVAEINWAKRKLEAETLVKLMDSILPRSSWSNHAWKYNDGVIDNDAFIDVENGMVLFFSFRCDLTQKDLAFLKQMLAICERFDLNLFDLEGEVSIPPYDNMDDLIKGSRNYRYLIDPVGFFGTLDRTKSIKLPYIVIGEEE
ncbi:MAG: hypothetical protein AAF741_10845 [Bacteroidota bacterium]